MKKYLLPETGSFYKANLHCHTTISDGRWTPEEVKKNYMEKGYSVIAYTDHNLLISHQDLAEENFLPLNALEININNDEYSGKYGKTCHLCAIAIDPDNLTQPCWHREKYLGPHTAQFKDLIKFDDSKPDWERVYSSEGVNAVIDECKNNGFFVTYNHPTWSMEGHADYINYNNMNAMEICNYECVCIGHDEHNSKEYDEMLRSGKRIYCVATDDNHNTDERESSFGGFTMIKADELEYRAITDALVKGNFYASEGPIIDELWYEDGKVYITFQPAREVFITKGTRVRGVGRIKGEKGELITKACFDVEEDDIYFRITVEGPDGKRAYTNAYFMDDIIKD